MVGCIDEFNARQTGLLNLITVEGTLTDFPERQFVSIRRSQSLGNSVGEISITDATVELVANGSEVVQLKHETLGQYVLPTTTKIVQGSRYKLRFRTKDGQQYESDEQTMPSSTSFTAIRNEFQPKAILSDPVSNRYLPAHNLYIDAPDRPNEANFYEWTYTLWEQQSVCATCQQGIYNRSGNTGNCVTQRSLAADNLYDYICEGTCYDIVRSQNIVVFSDRLLKNNQLINQLAAQVPFYQEGACLVELRQFNLTADAYQYRLLLNDQVKNKGSLADTPPASLVGNIRNVTNASEKVVGHFSVAGGYSMRYWLDRPKTASATSSVRALGLLGGRAINPEPAAPPFRPPFAVCVPSLTRTPITPAGWRN
ncbi:MAG: DUF4249 domain-containing protein [Cytophagales bacterium]|nr:MAG: DUF4249 domain-containing protein [Cytophagales bacterium]